MKRIAGVAAALLVAALSACSGPTSAPEPTTTPKSDQTVDTAPTPTRGLDVRYLDDDGSVKTVTVRSFPR